MENTGIKAWGEQKYLRSKKHNKNLSVETGSTSEFHDLSSERFFA